MQIVFVQFVFVWQAFKKKSSFQNVLQLLASDLQQLVDEELQLHVR